MDNAPLIGIMQSNRRRRELSNNFFYINDLNLKLFSFAPADIIWSKKEIQGIYLEDGKWIEASFPFPDVIYNRCYRNVRKTIRRLEKYIGKNKCFNCINHFNKWRIYKSLSNSIIKDYLPETFPCNKDNIINLLEKHKKFYLKPSLGHKGRGVYLIKLGEADKKEIYKDTLFPREIITGNDDLFDKIIQYTWGRKYIVQQGVDLAQIDGKYFDIRVLVQKNTEGNWDTTTIVSRIAHHNIFNTSLCQKVCTSVKVFDQLYKCPVKRDEVLEELNKVSLIAAKIIEAKMGQLGEMAVDFGLDGTGKLWIIEVNGKPQKTIYDNIEELECKELIYKRPLEYADYLSKSK